MGHQEIKVLRLWYKEIDALETALVVTIDSFEFMRGFDSIRSPQEVTMRDLLIKVRKLQK